ncbi:unnamed protein product [Thlaspi arvense]|uniref:Uncharacterized protein n=1 Tax=Thlaspi arvense TaxID=13288 RepID=A0AAU9RAL1_THLAR|nr:unnamed protein product [Thlaspi arvense]
MFTASVWWQWRSLAGRAMQSKYARRLCCKRKRDFAEILDPRLELEGVFDVMEATERMIKGIAFMYQQCPGTKAEHVGSCEDAGR